MTIEEQRKAIIEDAKAAGFETYLDRIYVKGFFSALEVNNELTKFAQLQAARNQSNNVAVALPPIERDEQMDRTYIPLPGGWEIQTKGKGSSFRIANTKGDCPRYLVTDEYLHGALEQMARDIHTYTSPQQSNALDTLLYLQKHELWANSHAKEVINSAIKSAQPESDGK